MLELKDKVITVALVFATLCLLMMFVNLTGCGEEPKPLDLSGIKVSVPESIPVLVPVPTKNDPTPTKKPTITRKSGGGGGSSYRQRYENEVEKNNELQAQIDGLVNQIAGLTTQVTDDQAFIDGLNATIAQLLLDNATLTAQLQAANATVQTQLELITALQVQIAECEGQPDLSEQLAALQAALNAAENNLLNAQNTITDLNEQIDEFNDTTAALNLEIAALIQELNEDPHCKHVIVQGFPGILHCAENQGNNT